ncbi:MAG: flagellar biosynthetic protein FliO [Chloroflexi bacterium]|nr:flagellar biosynthetic protein FliO [Chloroflexota bacterium]
MRIAPKAVLVMAVLAMIFLSLSCGPVFCVEGAPPNKVSPTPSKTAPGSAAAPSKKAAVGEAGGAAAGTSSAPVSAGAVTGEKAPPAGNTDEERLDEIEPVGGTSNFMGVLGKAAFGLVIVCVFALLVLYFFYGKRSHGIGPVGKNRSIRLLEKLDMPPNKSLYLVEVLGRYLLLGVTEKDITVLEEIPPESVPEEVKEKIVAPGVQAPAMNLQSFLANFREMRWPSKQK